MIDERELCDPWLPSTDLGPILGPKNPRIEKPPLHLRPGTTARAVPRRRHACSIGVARRARPGAHGGRPPARPARAGGAAVWARPCATCAHCYLQAGATPAGLCVQRVRDRRATTAAPCARDARTYPAIAAAICARRERTPCATGA
ncbi:hypothetical protein F511_14306 [Dorcoceras hygrometricum]|uniref:Uncharacterized protein n=1 Tax=Dorcoceras hygrometricum TaxID=472368 RepID=A0A2Z7BRN3_9LAMI|nr:hypothetical protein F511_14306 [Dorcoceras hygrometricum]